MLTYTEAVLVLILTSGDTVLDTKVVRAFKKPWHCAVFNHSEEHDNDRLAHGYRYWHKNKKYAQPGYTISFECRHVGPIYTA